MQNQLLNEAQRISNSWHTAHQKLLDGENEKNKERLLYEERSLERTMQNLVAIYHAYLAKRFVKEQQIG